MDQHAAKRKTTLIIYIFFWNRVWRTLGLKYERNCGYTVTAKLILIPESCQDPSWTSPACFRVLVTLVPVTGLFVAWFHSGNLGIFRQGWDTYHPPQLTWRSCHELWVGSGWTPHGRCIMVDKIPSFWGKIVVLPWSNCSGHNLYKDFMI